MLNRLLTANLPSSVLRFKLWMIVLLLTSGLAVRDAHPESCADVSDSFTAGGSLSSNNWTMVSPSSGGYGLLGNVAATVQPLSANSQGLALWTGKRFTPDQCAQVVVTSNLQGVTGPAVLMDSTGTGYFWFINNLRTIYKLKNGAGAGSTGAACPTPAVGDTIRLSYVAKTHMLTCADLTQGTSGSAVDYSYIAGSPGVLVDRRTTGWKDSLGSFSAASSATTTGTPVATSPITSSACADISDNFSPNGFLSSTKWMMVAPSSGGYSTLSNISGTVQPLYAKSQGLAISKGKTFAPDQCAQVVVTSNLQGVTGPAVLMDSKGNGYFWFVNNLRTIYKLKNGAGAGSTGAVCPPPAVGDTIRLSYVSATHTLTCADLTQGTSASAVDNTYVAGSPGVLVDRRTAGWQDSLGNFSAASTVSVAAKPPVVVIPPIVVTAPVIVPPVVVTSPVVIPVVVPPIVPTAPVNTGSGNTWYVRSDGGTRYSAKATSGQCDGLADVSYASTGGKGTNRHCAFNDYRFLWDDQSYNNDEWVIAGGDTVIIRNGPWRVGYNNQIHGSEGDPWCFGGGTTGCANPTIPAGTAANPTKIYGENYASCSTGGSVDKTKVTQLYAGWHGPQAINLSGAVNVEVKCIEVTQHSNCRYYGNPNPNPCQHGGVDEDWAADGVSTSPTTENVKIEDFWTHGHQGRGFKGPIKTLTCNRCLISNEAFTGWDFDDGSGSNAGNGTAFPAGAVWTFTNSIIEGSGCKEEYPIAHEIPWQAGGCFGQSNGGQGDGVGTPPMTGLSAVIDHAIFRYNTQDGLDLGHVDTGSNTLSITNSKMYGNNGGTYKWGGFYDTVYFANNLAVANCLRMSQAIPGAPEGFNTNLTDYCRAGDAFPFDFKQGSKITIVNNTIVTYAPTTFDIDCWQAGGGGVCSDAVVTFKNNIVMGYNNPSTYSLGGQAGGPGLWNLNNAQRGYTFVRTNNLFYGFRNAKCPTGNPSEYCIDPLFVNEPIFNSEASLDNFNFNPSIGSPLKSTGVAIPSVTLDYNGVKRGNPPSIGAME